MGTIDYHKNDLKIALDVNNQNRILPELSEDDKVILDIGCGIGQSFIALNCTEGRKCIGIDIDKDALEYGKKHFGKKIQFIHADATSIPLSDKIIDLVYCRVSLPYTNIPKAIKEIKRVLRTGGKVWMTLHSKKRMNESIIRELKSRNIKNIIHRGYTLINGYLLKYFGVVFPFVNGRYESWQDARTVKKLLIRNHFNVNIKKIGRHTIIEGLLH